MKKNSAIDWGTVLFLLSVWLLVAACTATVFYAIGQFIGWMSHFELIRL